MSPNPSLERGLLPRVFFPFDSDFLTPESSKSIKYNIDWMNENSAAYIILEGHCDEVGQSEYNMELGDKRARAVESYMIEHGIPEERIIMIVSYGSERPLNLGHEIKDLRENRRVEFIVR
ncbi:MAG: OmpA family protein [Deltaproteobacteria bacterium]|nr:OmpA family protein [Deltaproteobacteria bacterium]